MLTILDITCFVLHTLLIVFNMVGWIWRRTRVIHLLTLSLTIFSWFVLGIWFGWGYCFCADWHFRIRRELGYQDPETSYIELLVRQLTGLSISRTSADCLAMTVLVLIVLATSIVWYRDRRPRTIHRPA